jgi:hypothetical protein
MSRRSWSFVLGAGCLGFAGWAFARTERLAALIGSDLATARAMAVRDLGSGIVLLTARDPRPAMAARVLYDVSDAVLFGRGRPKVAASALGFAALGVAGLRAR